MLNFATLENLTTAPKFNVVVSTENEEKDVLKFVKRIKPKWGEKSISIQRMEIGVINHLFKCSEKDDQEIVVRVYATSVGDKMDEAFDHTKELKNFEKLKGTGLTPELLAVFTNGICYNYVKGEVLTCTSVRSEKIIPHVTKLLATFNALPAPDWTTPCSVDEMDRHMYYPPKLDDQERMKRFFKFLPNEEAFKKEYEHCKNYFVNLKSPKVYCHNDTKGENMIWNESKGELKLIDLEHNGVNFQAFEVGSHFAAYTDFINPKLGCFPSRDFQLKWIRLYLQFYYEATGRSASDVTDNDVECLYVQSNKMAQFFRFWCANACCDLVENGVFDCFEFCMVNLQEYFEFKDEVDAMVMPSEV